eukprot:2532307-Rhodomonas_salina.2
MSVAAALGTRAPYQTYRSTPVGAYLRTELAYGTMKRVRMVLPGGFASAALASRFSVGCALYGSVLAYGTGVGRALCGTVLA